MKKLFIIFVCLIFLSTTKPEENLELRIFNNSKFKIEKLKISYKGQEVQFQNIEPKSYSETIAIKGLWKDNCYDLTVFRKKFLAKNFWTHQICFPVDHTRNNKIEKGKYILSLKIKRIDTEKIAVESEYIAEKKNESN